MSINRVQQRVRWIYNFQEEQHIYFNIYMYDQSYTAKSKSNLTQMEFVMKTILAGSQCIMWPKDLKTCLLHHCYCVTKLELSWLFMFYKATLDASPLKAFLDAVLGSSAQKDVSYVEFEEYYEGCSFGIEDDEDFKNILRNTWTIWRRNQIVLDHCLIVITVLL